MEKRISEVDRMTTERLNEVVDVALGALQEELYQTRRKSVSDIHPITLRVIKRNKKDLDGVSRRIGNEVDTKLPGMYQIRGFDTTQGGANRRNDMLAAEYVFITSILNGALR